jgi:hypothetical protein
MDFRWWTSVMLIAACATQTEAADPFGWRSSWRNCNPTMRICPSMGCCPDDYDRKPCPAISACLIHRGPDDYCRKPLPCLPAVAWNGDQDDYCRKPMPCLLCPNSPAWFQCGALRNCDACDDSKTKRRP